jgi:CRP-like cAMP-binding protein
MSFAAETTVARLARTSFLRGADAAILAEVAPLAQWLTLRAGEQAVSFGDSTNDVFLIEEGTVRVIIQTSLGQEVIFGDLGAGELFGEIAAIDGAPRSASVTAIHLTRLCKLPAESFLQVVLRSPDVGRRLMRKLVERLRIQDERNLELAALPVRLRLVAELLRLSRQREATQAMKNPGSLAQVVSPPPPHHVLAARVGARREAVSRELGALVREGLLVVTPRSIILQQPAALQALVDSVIGNSEDNGTKSLRK